tara:strand:+ start:103 stop:1695 length:1593 start_codon:yes stop_codon:yes gene_type:complete
MIKPQNIFFLFVPIISLIGGLWQNQFIYDAYHWGFIHANALELLNGKIPYKEIFLEYGILSVLINSLLLIIFDKNLFSLIAFTCLCYSITLYLIGAITLRLTKNRIYSLLVVLVLFLLYPWPTQPWPNFYSFMFSCLFIINYLNNNLKKSYAAGIYLACAYLCLTTIFNFIIIFYFLSISLTVVIFRKILDKESLIKLRNILITFFLSITIYFIYLYSQNLISIWITYQKLPFIFNNAFEGHSIFGFLIKYANFVFLYSFKNFILEPQWSLYSIFILSNFFLIILNIRNLYKKNEIKINTELLFVNLYILSLNFYGQILGLLKLSTSMSLGAISLAILILKIKSDDTKLMINFMIVFMTLYSLIFSYDLKDTKMSAKRHMHLNELVDRNVKIGNDKFKFFKNQKWKKENWEILSMIAITQNKINSNCKIEFGANLTVDVFYHSMIRYKKIQVIPFFFKHTGHILRGYIEPDLIKNIQKLINNENIYIITTEGNDKLLDLENYDNPILIELENKKVNKEYLKIFFPKNCYF